MKICAVILNYFGHKDTITCVKTLLDKNHLSKIVIVDNSSDKNEFNILNSIFEKTNQVEILEAPQNLGFAGGVNLAVSMELDSGFDAFLLINNDTLVPPGTIKKMSKSIEDKDYDVAAPLIYCYPEKNKIWAKANYYNRYIGLVTQNKTSLIPGTIFYLSGCCLLIHQNVFRTAGLLDESFFMYCEDVEFCFRAAQCGFKAGVTDKALIYHKGNASSRLNSLFYEYNMTIGHFLLCNFISRNRQEQYLSIFIKIFSFAFKAIFRAFKFKNINSILGYRKALIDFIFKKNETNHKKQWET